MGIEFSKIIIPAIPAIVGLSTGITGIFFAPWIMKFKLSSWLTP